MFNMDIDRLKKIYARTGPFYDVLDFPWEMIRYRKIRPVVWAEAAGARRILDAGIGSGRNVPHYPAGAEVHGVDLSEAMLGTCRARKRRLNRAVHLICGSITGLPHKTAVFDAVISTFLFCVLPDPLQPPALSELARVLRPGGKLVLLEYVYSRDPRQRRIMSFMAPLVEWLYGARFDRKTTDHLKAGGWRIESERFVAKDILKLIIARRT